MKVTIPAIMAIISDDDLDSDSARVKLSTAFRQTRMVHLVISLATVYSFWVASGNTTVGAN